LITGAGGFVGRHLAERLKADQPEATLYGTLFSENESYSPSIKVVQQLDLKDEHSVRQFVAKCRPDHIYHLAAQAFVPRSFEDPWETLENNIRSQLNIIQTCIALDIRPRMLIISSAEIYGAIQPDELPLSENTPLRPANPYSVSKVTQDMLGLQYYISHQMPIMRARPFNHIGPRQNTRFVLPAFATQIAKIEAGLQESVIYVGNLAAQRDFTDVRDIVRAYRFIVERGKPGQAYNIASGRTYSIRQLLDTLLSLTEATIEVKVKPELLRPVDIPVIQGDSSRLSQDTGWQAEISFEQTLKDVLDECRQYIHSIQ